MKGAAFAMLPFRAIGDTRLTGLDLRILAAVAWHDRASGPRGKGPGCYASNKKLAEEVDCDYTNLSSSITKLGRLGYVERTPNPLNKKLRIYRVIYESLLTDKVNALSAGKPSSLDKRGSYDLDYVSSATANTRKTFSASPIVCRDFEERKRPQGVGRVEYIPRSGEEITPKCTKNSVETAPIGVGHGKSVGASLAEIERTMKRGNLKPDQVEELIANTSDLVDQCGDFDGPNFQRARRLFSDLECLRTEEDE